MPPAYELREYRSTPERIGALHRRFEHGTLALFARHGIDVLGMWTDAAEPHVLVYLMRFPDAGAREASWAAFRADHEWVELRRSSEADGPLVEQSRVVALDPVPYVPSP